MAVQGVTRSPALGQRGMVCSSSPLASSAGINVLLQGGNAFDAAIAVAAAETVTISTSCGLGGDAFAILYHAASGRVVGLNGSGGAPSGATPDFFRSQGYVKMPIRGPLSITVPGEVAAWESLHDGFCTLPMEQLLAPAIGYARNGHPLLPSCAPSFNVFLDMLSSHPSTRRVLTKDGVPYGPGDVIVLEDMAKSLESIAKGGPQEFYRGDLAAEMVEALQEVGVPFTLEDFASHQTEVYEPPIVTDYRGHAVYQTRPPSQGLVHLSMLNLMNGFDLSSLGPNSPQAVHLMVEAKKLAFEDRNRYAGDPRYVDWPLDLLISMEHADRRRELIDPDHVRADAPAKVPAERHGDTSYFCVADGEGNAVSFIHSLSNRFGSGFIAGNTGVLLNNRGGRGFSLEEGHPNLVGPGKRTMHTLNCYMVFDDVGPLLIGGTPGGDYQVQANAQIVSNVLDYGMPPQEAVDAPRWESFPGSDPGTIETPLEFRPETGFPMETSEALERMGHRVAYPSGRGVRLGKVQLIMRDNSRGVLIGASDPRGDGHAAAL